MKVARTPLKAILTREPLPSLISAPRATTESFLTILTQIKVDLLPENTIDLLRSKQPLTLQNFKDTLLELTAPKPQAYAQASVSGNNRFFDSGDQKASNGSKLVANSRSDSSAARLTG